MTFHKYKKIKTLGDEDNKDIFTNPNDEIVIQEKIDGANFRFTIRDGKLIVGSRNQELDIEEHDKNWVRCIKHLSEKVIPHLDNPELQSKIFYGEACLKHTIDYDWDKMPPYLGFDIFDHKTDRFMSHGDMKKLFKLMDLEIVPTVKIVQAQYIKDVTDNDVPLSKYAKISAQDRQAEGIVFKNYSKQLYAKFVRDAFKEKNAEVFGGSPKYGEGEDAKFVLRYCTNARIEKAIYKHLDEGHKLELPLMKFIPNYVVNDIWEEEWKEIIKKTKVLDFKRCKVLITKRVLGVLKQMIVNTSLANK